MRRILLALALPALLLSSSCGPIASPGSTPPPAASVNSVTAGAIRVSFRALDTAASMADVLLDTKVVKAGTPEALKIADGLDRARKWLNAASTAQRIGEADTAAAAFTQAEKALGAVQDALGRKPS